MQHLESWRELLPPLLEAAGLVDGGVFDVVPLTGGVSSDIVRVRLAGGRDVCAKRALPQLKVAGLWEAPVSRNRNEVAWLRRADVIVPGAVPAVLAEDAAHGVALLEYLPPAGFTLWKTDLLAGKVDRTVAAAVGDVIGRIHAATLNDPAVAAEFATDDAFDALRLDPYLRTTAARNPEIAASILACLERTRSTKLALVHGDLSPKNTLVARADGHPVILDAECAWYGDPAFDGAFCLNHLVLKAMHMPASAAALMAAAASFVRAWLPHFPADVRDAVGARIAVLLPCLMLARIDGKSPVEYLSAESREAVRLLARRLIAAPAANLDDVFAAVGEKAVPAGNAR